MLSADADVRSLIESHRSNAFDRAGLEVDKGLAFPIERLRELEANGRIGSISAAGSPAVRTAMFMIR